MVEICQIDAFAERPFRGNPAAVCLLETDRPEAWMQAVAAEMALSETAFLRPRDDGSFSLRWFTPAVEVDLCGHATLASAHWLWETGRLDPAAEAVFHTRSGRLGARRSGGWIEMDFPADPPRPAPAPEALTQALGVPLRETGRSRLYLLAEVEDAAVLADLQPDLERLRDEVRDGVIVTCASSTSGFDFLSRFFAPALGVDEDPVTGSAHCVLAPYWSARLGRQRLTGYQASARGGVVRVALDGERVRLSGRAVTVLRGELVDAEAP